MITAPDEPDGAVQVARDVSATVDVLDGLRMRLALIAIVVAVAAALLGWLLMRRTTRPLEDLTAATERVARTRDLTPLDLDRSDEVGRLADSFDRMLGALALSRDQQQRLVQDAAHELRTPLTSLRANIEFLDRARNLPDDELDSVLGGLNEELVELSALFDELIQLASETDDTSTARDVDLAEVVEEAVDRFRRRTAGGHSVDRVDPGARRVQPVGSCRHQPAGQRGQVQPARGADRRGPRRTDRRRQRSRARHCRRRPAIRVRSLLPVVVARSNRVGARLAIVRRSPSGMGAR